MSGTKYLKGACAACGGHLEFPADATGTVIDCPHCGQPTELMLPAPPDEPAVPRKTVLWTVVAVLVMAAGLAGAFAALKLSQKWAARQSGPTAPAPIQTNIPPPPEDPFAKAGFRVGEPSLQKVAGSKLIYAVGELANTTARQRFGVRVELDLLDAAGRKVGTAKDYQSVIEANGRWEFRALVVESKTASVKVAAVKEDQ